jgi:hypothetical protein
VAWGEGDADPVVAAGEGGGHDPRLVGDGGHPADELLDRGRGEQPGAPGQDPALGWLRQIEQASFDARRCDNPWRISLPPDFQISGKGIGGTYG